jgi:enhancing lycopene biosynthesis protein 2
MAKRVGVVLSGCGVFDGSEIHEAVSILIALDKRGAQVVCMAPDIPQATVVNHYTTKPDPHPRKVIEEAARIARGRVVDMASVKADQLDALIFPGGFGAAKNLSTYATDGPNCKVNIQVERLLLEMHAARKPIGLACIAPVLAARVFGARGVNPKLTVGRDKSVADAIRGMQAQHQDAGETDICVDDMNRIVTTPCYMNNVGPWIVYSGADKMVDQVLRMC